jgi:hypothetical protein
MTQRRFLVQRGRISDADTIFSLLSGKKGWLGYRRSFRAHDRNHDPGVMQFAWLAHRPITKIVLHFVGPNRPRALQFGLS